MAGDDGRNNELEALGVDTVRLGGRELIQERPFRAATRGLYNRAARSMITEWIKEHDTPDTVYHVHGWAKILSPSVFTALSAVAGRTVIHAHDFFLACPNGSFVDYGKGEACHRRPLSLDCLTTNCDKRSFAQKLWRVGRSATLRRTLDGTAPWAAVLMIHEKMQPYLELAGYLPNVLLTLRNPTVSFCRERVKAEENRDFVFIGRIEPAKGVEQAIAASRRAEASLTVIGDGPLREELASKYPDIRFLGWRSRSEISRDIVSARALIMPSLCTEPFGLVAVEASRSGLPVIASGSAFLADELEAAGLGFRCEPRDVDSFAALLRQVLAISAEEMRAMSERAFSAEIKLSTSPEEWISSLIQIYERTCAGERPEHSGLDKMASDQGTI
ncbi:MAG TPA: glycosyltransferase [Pararhizobium sp.]|nr:glycosyltransferase [Pararhizobium sp.]